MPTKTKPESKVRKDEYDIYFDAKGHIKPGSPLGKLQTPHAGPGRPPEDIKELARDYSEAAIRKLAMRMASSERDEVELKASVALLDRGWGHPVQPVSNAVTEEDLNAMFVRWGLAARKVLVPAFGESRAAELMAEIKRKYDDLKDGDSDAD